MAYEHTRSGHVPGEAGLWVLILGDMTIFGVFFGVFAHARASERELFTQAQHELNFGIGLANTILLLTSSWLVALAVKNVRGGDAVRGSRYFLFALLCGLVFLADKLFEYSSKLSAGLTPMTNDFLMYFYVLTGIHAVHLIIGMSLLLFLWRRTRTPTRTPTVAVTEGCASYWHLVDILWIVLFPLLYLM
ncbi:cytochrome c oxidase subunit 3 [Nocardia sp. NPDC004860]|uniref:cytochrome c oxidase subunit 3 n=1 Tax=Nocardia sp. NPDC004860 TaxID=3154557 RepID=UPI0033A535C8